MSPSQARTARQSREATRRMPGAPAPIVLDRYRLARRLGTGAFGTVWLAHDERLDRDVAVKILARERIVGGRFEREARTAARLAHPAIVTLYEAAVDDEGAYLVSELVLGCTLDELLAQGRLSDRDVVAIAIALCDALEHAHAQGVVHRDVKPSNVLVPEAPASTAQLAKLTDFGVARVVGGDSLTITGDVIGTLAYMAPEQAEGLEAGPSADLYSLALVVYEALTGINPVRPGTNAQRARRLGAHLPPLRRQRRDLPRELGQGIDLALRPTPRERGSIAELRRTLALVLERVGDEPGVVAGAWSTSETRSTQDERSPAPAQDERSPAPAQDERGPAWPPRGLAAAGATALTAWLAVTALAPSPVPPAVAGLLAGCATLLLPRLGWAALLAALCATAALQAHLGGAVVILVALLLPVALLPARPAAWPLSAGAPALGLIGLAGAWPALAARAGSSWRRAALGAVGWIWLLLAGSLAGRVLYLPRVPGSAAPGVWMRSLPETVNHLAAPVWSSGALAPAAVWAVAAVVLPWLLGGRSAALIIIRVVVWAAIVTSASTVAVVAIHGSDRLGSAPTAAIGAVASAVVALAPLAVAAWREALHPPGSQARVP